MPKLSCLVASASAPTSRITPEIEKNQRLAPMKSKCQRRPSPEAPSALGRAQQPVRLMLPSSAWVKTTAVSSETIVPTPRVKAKPLTPGGRQHEEDEGGQQGDDVGVDDRRDPAFVAGADRARHRASRPHLLLYSLEDDDVGVGRDADRQHQPRDPRQGQGDRDQFDQGEEDHPVGAQRDRGDQAEEAVVEEQEEDDQGEADDPGLDPVVERLRAERRRDLGLADQLQVDRQGADLQRRRQFLRLFDRC